MKILLDVAVGGVVEHQAAGRLAVAAGAARLLVIRLQAAGDVVVDDEADVGLVDAHAEGVRGHDDLAASFHEVILGGPALVGQQAGMVDDRAAFAFARPLRIGHLFGPLARRGVDDARAGRLRGRNSTSVSGFCRSLRGDWTS